MTVTGTCASCTSLLMHTGIPGWGGCTPSQEAASNWPSQRVTARPLQARTKLSARPWRVDHFDQFADVWFSQSSLDEGGWGECTVLRGSGGSRVLYQAWVGGSVAWHGLAGASRFLEGG